MWLRSGLSVRWNASCSPSDGDCMSTEILGVVHGTTIELTQNPGIPDGAEVVVTLRQKGNFGPEKLWGEGIRRSAGVAADIEGYDEAFAEVQRQRKSATFRDEGP